MMNTTGQYSFSQPGPDCGSFANLLPLLGAGTLQAGDEDRLRLHLKTCAYCQMQRATYDRMDLALRRYFGASATLLLLPEDIMSFTDHESGPTEPLRAPSAPLPSTQHRPRRVFTWAAAIAAVLVIALITTALFVSHRPGGSPTGNQPSATSSVTVYGSASYSDDTSADSTLFALNGTTGKPLWTNKSTTTERILPVVEKGVFYIGSSDGVVSAYRASNGKLLWSQKLLDKSFVDQVADGVVIAHSFDLSSGHDPYPATIFALDASTGHELWRRPFTTNVIPQAFVDGAVYAAREGDMSIQHGVLYALNARDGSERWQLHTQGSPIVGQVADGQVYVLGQWVVGNNGSDERALFYAVDAATGQQRWSYSQNSAYLLGPVGVGNGLVFILSNAGNGLAMRELDALSTSNGSRRWKAPIEQNFVQAFYDNGVITVGMEGAITTYRASDGQLLSNTPIAKGGYLTLVANGVFYVVASNNLLAVDARSGKELWHYTGLGVDVKAVANGLVYTTIVKGSAGTDSAIAALNASTGKVRWTYDIGHDAVDTLIVK